jgi:hypothetical protein
LNRQTRRSAPQNENCHRVPEVLRTSGYSYSTFGLSALVDYRVFHLIAHDQRFSKNPARGSIRIAGGSQNLRIGGGNEDSEPRQGFNFGQRNGSRWKTIRSTLGAWPRIHKSFITSCSQQRIDGPFSMRTTVLSCFRYVWGILKNHGCHLYRINGVEDHMHMLISLPPRCPCRICCMR